MKLVFSRKGFDSSSGGCPNPVFPDGSVLALPIPDVSSVVSYRDLTWRDINMGTLVHQLTNGRIRGPHKAHLDPDLDASVYPRDSAWRPVFGQHGSAQGHLEKEGVGKGDVFVFFGLFRQVERVKRRWRFVPGSRAHHRIWGWLQVDQVIKVDESLRLAMPWLGYHPHLQGLFQGQCRGSNVVYLGRKQLTLNAHTTSLPGSGVFRCPDPELQLSDSHSYRPSDWRLPRWLYPDRRKPLSYHLNADRWRLDGEHCYLRSAARGQEFVLDGDDYPEAEAWFRELVQADLHQN